MMLNKFVEVSGPEQMVCRSCTSEDVHDHKSRLRAHTRLSNGDKSKDDLIYRHFHAPGHHGLEDVGIKLINKAPHEFKLLDKEGQWAHRLKGIKPPRT